MVIKGIHLLSSIMHDLSSCCFPLTCPFPWVAAS